MSTLNRHADAATTSNVLALFFVGTALWLLLRRRPVEPARTSLNIVALNLWVLDRICLSLATLAPDLPGVRELRLDVRSLAVLDEGSILALSAAVATLNRTQVHLVIDGYTVGMVRLAVARGIDRQHFGRPRPSTSSPAQQMH